LLRGSSGGKRLADLFSDTPVPARRGQAALTALVESEIARWIPVIRAFGITQ
jgi:hypothetical protein